MNPCVFRWIIAFNDLRPVKSQSANDKPPLAGSITNDLASVTFSLLGHLTLGSYFFAPVASMFT